MARNKPKRKKRKYILLLVLAVIIAACVITDTRRTSVPFEQVYSYEKRDNNGVYWMLIEENGFISASHIVDEIKQSQGFVPIGLFDLSEYSYVVVYGGTLDDLSYPNQPISSWIIKTVFGKEYESPLYLRVKQADTEKVTVYRIEKGNFYEDVHSNDNRQMKVVR